MIAASPREWTQVTRSAPCPICGKPDWCQGTSDGAAHCMRIEDAPPGWRLLKTCPKGGRIFRPADDAAQQHVAHNGSPNGTKQPKTYPTLDSAVRAWARQLGPHTGTWTYHAADGTDALYVARFDPPDDKKKYRPFHHNGTGFVCADPPGQLPLYRLPHLNGQQRMYITEGEKAADALAALGLPVTTSAHGSKSAAMTDWEPLKGRDIVVLPDHDAPGKQYAETVVSILNRLGCTVRVLNLPDLVDPGDDAVEFIATRRMDGKDNAAIVQEIIDLADLADPIPPAPPADDAADDTDLPAVITFAALREQHPELRPVVIDGLVRRGETMTMVAATKSRKTFTAYALALSVITGGRWLDTYPCSRGRVLIADNELHQPTLASRIPKVAQALGIPPQDYADKLDVLSLRGRNVCLNRLRPAIQRIEHGYYDLIILDAWYRLQPPGTSENSNSDIMSMFNTLDDYAAMTDAAWCVIHHSSKGNQGEKAITDVGAGAGAQSRAADTHLILRPHEEEDCVVLEAAVRSFAPVAPLGLRWQFPLWRPAYTLNTEAIKGRKSRHDEQRDRDDQHALDALRAALAKGPQTARFLRGVIKAGDARTTRLLDILIASGEVVSAPQNVKGGTAHVYQLTH